MPHYIYTNISKIGKETKISETFLVLSISQKDIQPVGDSKNCIKMSKNCIKMVTLCDIWRLTKLELNLKFNISASS